MFGPLEVGNVGGRTQATNKLSRGIERGRMLSGLLCFIQDLFPGLVLVCHGISLAKGVGADKRRFSPDCTMPYTVCKSFLLVFS